MPSSSLDNRDRHVRADAQKERQNKVYYRQENDKDEANIPSSWMKIAEREYHVVAWNEVDEQR